MCLNWSCRLPENPTINGNIDLDSYDQLINELQQQLTENNATIESLNEVIRNCDEAADTTSFVTVTPNVVSPSGLLEAIEIQEMIISAQRETIQSIEYYR